MRQGVCPFHEETEGSFTVYADSERWFCFGCGEGGDVLDFVRRVESLTLPEAIQRLGGGVGMGVPGVVVFRPRVASPPRRTVSPPHDPALLTAAARFYAGQLRRSPESASVPALAGHPVPRRQPASASATRRAAGCAPTSLQPGSPPQRLKTSGLFTEHLASGSRGWWSSPT